MSLPDQLERVVESFHRAPKPLRLQLLLEFARKVPELPPHLSENRDALERVHECQTPFFLATEIAADGGVRLHFEAPEQAPTTRGFAGILSEGLAGQPADAILAVPDDFYTRMGLAEVISPMRLRGMSAIMHRLKRQLAARGSDATDPSGVADGVQDSTPSGETTDSETETSDHGR